MASVRKTTGRRNSLRHYEGEERLAPRFPREKDEAEDQVIAECLRANPNLQRQAPFTEEQIRLLVAAAWREHVREGRSVMDEGDLSNAMFWIVAEGSFEVTASVPFEVVTVKGMSYLSRPPQPTSVKGKITKQIHKNTSFGDSSMLYNAPRWATVKATTNSVLWAFSHSDFAQAQALNACGADGSMTPEDRSLVASALSANANLRKLTPLTAGHIEQLVGVAWKQEIEEGTVLMQEGDLNADAFFIVLEGSLELMASEPFEVVSEGEISYLSRASHVGRAPPAVAAPRTVRTLGRGLCFGEISMLYCAPRFATITAKSRSVLWSIDRRNFQEVQIQACAEELKSRTRYLEGWEMLSSFGREGREKVAVAMERVSFVQGDVLFRQGEAGTTCLTLTEGSVVRVVEGGEEAASSQCPTLRADPAIGTLHRFGEEALRGKPYCETLRVASPAAVALALEVEELTRIWDGVLDQTPAVFQRYVTSVSKKAAPSTEGLTPANLDVVGLLGTARFGPVELCRHKTRRELFALKKLDKGLVVQRGLRRSIMREKAMWLGAVSPFIIRAYETFNTPESLCFLLEAALGGQLSAAYRAHGLFGKAGHARFYAAGVLLGLEHFHKNCAVYRNLKPENVLLSHLGWPKLTDMSLAKLVVGRTFTTCGAREYMAPEIIAGVGHNRAADLWSLGILVFELMSGSSPFRSDSNPMETYSNVMRGIASQTLPKACSGAAGRLIISMLQPLSFERLAMRTGGLKNVMDHEWFAGFDWPAMRRQALKPPYLPAWRIPPESWREMPELEASVCLAHCSPRPEALPDPVQYADDGSGWDAEFATAS